MVNLVGRDGRPWPRRPGCPPVRILTRYPRPSSSPWIRSYPQPRVLPCHPGRPAPRPGHQPAGVLPGGDGPTASGPAAGAGPATYPALRAGLSATPWGAAGSGAASTARSAQTSFGPGSGAAAPRPLVGAPAARRPSTPPSASSASRPARRTNIRKSSRIHGTCPGDRRRRYRVITVGILEAAERHGAGLVVLCSSSPADLPPRSARQRGHLAAARGSSTAMAAGPWPLARGRPDLDRGLVMTDGVVGKPVLQGGGRDPWPTSR